MFAVRNIETVRSRENFGLFKLELQSFHDVCRTVNTDYGPIRTWRFVYYIIQSERNKLERNLE